MWSPTDRDAREWVRAHSERRAGPCCRSASAAATWPAPWAAAAPGRFPGTVTTRAGRPRAGRGRRPHHLGRRARRGPPFVVARRGVAGDERAVPRRYDVAPRSHPERRQGRRAARAGRRCRCVPACRPGTGSHRHPPAAPADHARTQVSTRRWQFDRPLVVWVDGVRWGTARERHRHRRARRPHRLRLTRAPARRVGSAAMQAWILDESPGSYRLGEIDPPAGRRRRRAGPRGRQCAEPHGPVGHPGHAEAAAAARARLRRRRRGRGGGRRRHRRCRSATKWSSTPASRRSTTSSRWGNDSPMGPGFMIYGEHCWGGHATFAVAPSRNVRPRPAGRIWARVRGVSAGVPHRLPHAAPRPGAGRRHRARRRHRLGRLVRSARHRPSHGLRGRGHQPQRGQARRGARRWAPSLRHDSADGKWPVEADVVIESVGPATWEQSVRSLKPGGRLVVCGGTSGPKVELNLPRLFFKQIEIIGSTMGSYEEFDAGLRAGGAGAAPSTSTAMYRLEEYVDALARLEQGEQLGKIVLGPTESEPTMTDTEALKQAVCDRVDELAPTSSSTPATQIHAHPELNYEEHFAHDLLTDLLESSGVAPVRSRLRHRDRLRLRRPASAGPPSRCCASTTRCPASATPAGTTSSPPPGSARASRQRSSPKQAGGRVRIMGTPGRGGWRRQGAAWPAPAPSTASTRR